MKSTHERLTDFANDIYLLHDTAYDLRHDVGAIINWRRIFDIADPLNTSAINLMRDVKVDAEKLLCSTNQQLHPLPQAIRDNKQLKRSIKIMLAAVEEFCHAADKIMTLGPPSDDDKQVDKRRAIFNAAVVKQDSSDALIESINAMCKALKETELLVKNIRFHEGIRLARQT